VATLISPSRVDRLVGTLNRAPTLRTSTRDSRAAPRYDAVLLGTASFCGDGVYDVAGKFLGEIEELVIDIHSGRVAYGLMAVGGMLGMGRKLFAIPWNAVTVDRVYQRCVVKIDIERLIDSPSVDGDFLARMADPGWATQVHAYFGCKPYWE
jgi:sporulation protein YlmC with PRC-barrel domain